MMKGMSLRGSDDGRVRQGELPWGRLSLVVALALLGQACGPGAPQGPRVRYAHASIQELASVEGEQVVWYEFQTGDRFPAAFLLAGMAEATEGELQLVVRRPFWVVVFASGRAEFSFDGRRLVRNPFSRWGFLIGRGETRGSAAFVMYVGPANEAPAELR